MAADKQKQGGDLFIVDNSDEHWKALEYLKEWAGYARAFDIATGYFEIGSLLALDGQWQKLEKLRILMGTEVSARTRKALLAGIRDGAARTLDESIEKEKESNDFLTGVPAIVQAIQAGKIQCRAYTKEKFHAKAYITHATAAVIGSAALVGSSNFTVPGLTNNVELNIQLRREVEVLQDWYEKHWNEAEDITPDILRVIERHTRQYSPFEVYAKALQEFFRGHEITDDEWEQNHSRMYTVLATYQRHGYHGLFKRAQRYGGAFLCDGVGLGKTYIGLMLIERLVRREKKRVVLFVPKTARVPVWESKIRKYLPDLLGGFLSFRIYNHTDLLRQDRQYKMELEQMRQQADVVIIDEAHHFRNTGVRGEEGEERKSRYWAMSDICNGKQVYLLTATPVNNRLTDFQHMIELFSRGESDYFKAAPLGIHSLPGRIRTLEKAVEAAAQKRERELGESGVALEDDDGQTNFAEAEQVLRDDSLFEELVVQRSRVYVKKSLAQEDRQVLFPEASVPKVIPYSVKQTYGKLLKMVEEGFLEQVFPPSFRFGTGDVTDSTGRRSGQIDVVVEYPFLPSLPTGKDTPRLYLAEGVAAAIEVKSNVSTQWIDAERTGAQLCTVVRNFGATFTMGKAPGPRIPLFVVGYTGWNTIDTLRTHVQGGSVDGILVIDAMLFAGPDGIWGTGPWALWGLICCLHEARGHCRRRSGTHRRGRGGTQRWDASWQRLTTRLRRAGSRRTTHPGGAGLGLRGGKYTGSTL